MIVERIGEKVTKTSYMCLICDWKLSFNGTKQVGNHLKNRHLLNPPKKTTPEKNDLNINKELANEFLLKFIITGFLPFLIVENAEFKK